MYTLYYMYLKLESSNPDHYGVSCDAKHNSERVEDDADIDQASTHAHLSCLVILRTGEYVRGKRGIGKHCVAKNDRTEEEQVN